MNVRAGNLIAIRVVAAALKKVRSFATNVKVIIGCIMKLMRGGGDILRAYKCDRCGSFYEKYTMQGEVVLVDRLHYTKDICPECYKELEKWYKNEHVQKDIPESKYCKWIPVSERLPEEFETVMVTVIEEIRGAKQYVLYTEARYSKEDGWEWACESGADYWEEIDGVIAWMPLPEPYKESEEKDV